MKVKHILRISIFIAGMQLSNVIHAIILNDWTIVVLSLACMSILLRMYWGTTGDAIDVAEASIKTWIEMGGVKGVDHSRPTSGTRQIPDDVV